MAEKIESLREGGIDAPTRHALDWTNPDFYNQDKIDELINILEKAASIPSLATVSIVVFCSSLLIFKLFTLLIN